MTHDDSRESEPEAPEGHYWASIHDRSILVKNLSSGQSLALGGMLRRIRSDDYSTSLEVLGKLQLLLEALIVRPEDQAWLEEQMITDGIALEDFAFVFRGKADTVAQPEPAKKPRRGR